MATTQSAVTGQHQQQPFDRTTVWTRTLQPDFVYQGIISESPSNAPAPFVQSGLVLPQPEHHSSMIMERFPKTSWWAGTQGLVANNNKSIIFLSNNWSATASNAQEKQVLNSLTKTQLPLHQGQQIQRHEQPQVTQVPKGQTEPQWGEQLQWKEWMLDRKQRLVEMVSRKKWPKKGMDWRPLVSLDAVGWGKHRQLLSPDDKARRKQEALLLTSALGDMFGNDGATV